MALSKSDLFEIEAVFRFEADWLRKEVARSGSVVPSAIDRSVLARADKIDRGADLIMSLQGLDGRDFDLVMDKLRGGFRAMASSHDRMKAAEPKSEAAA